MEESLAGSLAGKGEGARLDSLLGPSVVAEAGGHISQGYDGRRTQMKKSRRRRS